MDSDNYATEFISKYVDPHFIGTLGLDAYSVSQWVRSGVDPAEAKRRFDELIFMNKWIYDGIALSTLRARLETAAKKLGVNING